MLDCVFFLLNGAANVMLSIAEEEVSEGCYVQLQGGLLLGTKRKSVATRAETHSSGTESQEEKGQGMNKY